MDAEIIRKFRLAHPFQPFRLILNDGREFDVTKPQHLAMAQNNSRVLVVTGAETAAWFSPGNIKEVMPILTVPSGQLSGAAK